MVSEFGPDGRTSPATGRPVADGADCALADLVSALRSLDYRDAANPGMPVFVAE